MSLEFLIPFLIVYVILWSGFYIFQKINFKNKFSENFSYRNTFSFETHNFISGSNVALRVGFLLCSILSIIPFIVYFFTQEIRYTLHIEMLVAGVFLLISVFLKIMLFFTKTLNIKWYISEYVFRMLTLFGSIILVIVGICTSISENLALYRENSSILWTFFVIFLVLLLVDISCLFNSKFFNWYNYEKDENGQIKKPKTIYFALYQWIFDFSEIIFVILMTFFMYFC